MRRVLWSLVVVLAFAGPFLGAVGCSANQPHQVVRPDQPHPPPAQGRVPVTEEEGEEEKPWYESGGEVAVVVVGIIFVLAGIAAPIFLTHH